MLVLCSKNTLNSKSNTGVVNCGKTAILRAQTPGSYHTLPALVQAMYAPETRGESAEARVEVR